MLAARRLRGRDMRQALSWMTVVVLCVAAGAMAGEREPDALLLEAQ